VNRCKYLTEVDLSDCAEITETALISLNKLENLEKLSVCRCHEIEPVFFAWVPMTIKYLPKIFRDIEHLSELNVYGNITDEGVDFLRRRLSPTIINGSCFSTVARISLNSFRRLK
jgi:hypothetical protein